MKVTHIIMALAAVATTLATPASARTREPLPTVERAGQTAVACYRNNFPARWELRRFTADYYEVPVVRNGETVLTRQLRWGAPEPSSLGACDEPQSVSTSSVPMFPSLAKARRTWQPGQLVWVCDAGEVVGIGVDGNRLVPIVRELCKATS
jgi:hypothetical protein